MQRIQIGLSRAASASGLRTLDRKNPTSWEFPGISQNCEDGIIDYLTRQIHKPNRYFIEVGVSDGTENNTSYLALARRYNGLMVDGNAEAVAWCKYLLQPMHYGLDFLSLFITRQNVVELVDRALFKDPDVFSLDTDGNDFFFVRALLEAGLRPKIAVVEYNSAFGPQQSISIKYQENFAVKQAYRMNLYYGCSIMGWRRLFETYGYKFVTVESNGANAFFIDPKHFPKQFLKPLRGLQFAENHSQLREYRMSWPQQWELIKEMEFEKI